MYNFKLTSCDTDSITICKLNQEPFTENEIKNLTNELNSLYEENIKWDFEGFIPTFIVLKAKNYIMYDGDKIKLKGSSLKSATLEPILKEMLLEMINALVFDKQNELVNIYHKYLKEAMNIKDMKKWAKKVSISSTTINSDRSNETRIIDALNRSNLPVLEGDRHYVFFKDKTTLELAQNFNGEYDKPTILKKLYKTTERFETILNIKELFLDYSLKRNQNSLMELVK